MLAVPLDQPLIQVHQNVALLARFAGNAEISHDEIEEFALIEPRIENERGGDAFFLKPLEQAVE